MNRTAEIQARLAEINAALDNASGEELTALETESRSLLAELDTIKAEAETKQQLRASIASGNAQTAKIPVAVPAKAAAVPEINTAEAEERAFDKFLRGTLAQMRAGESIPQNFSLAENDAVVPKSIANRIIEKVREICPIYAQSDRYEVPGTIAIPVYGDATDENGNTHNITAAYSEDFTELTADAGAFTTVNLGGYLIGALTKVGRQLVNNVNFDLVSFVVNKVAEALALFIEHECLVGTGEDDDHCTGAVNTSNLLLAGSTSAITADKLIDLQSQIPQVYQGGCVWTMHPKTFAALKKLKYTDGTYITNTDFTQEFPYRLLGKPVNLSDNMPQIGENALAVLYGRYDGLSTNTHENVNVQILREKYATQHAIGIVAWVEVDSKVTDPQKLAVLKMATS